MGIFTEIGNQIESGTVVQITSVSTNISGMLIPWVTAGLTIWVMVYAFAVIRGEAQEPMNRFIWDLTKKSFILYFALAAGIFQSTVIVDVESVTQQLTAAINGGAGGGECAASKSSAGIYAALDCSFTKFNNASDKIAKTTDVLLFKNTQDDIVEKIKRVMDVAIALTTILITGWFLSLAAVVMYALIFIEVVTVRLVLTIVFALGPLFIAALAFEPTKKYFEGWVSKVVYCVILQAIIILFIGVAFGILSSTLSDMVVQLVSAQDFMEYAVAVPKTLISVIITMLCLAFVFTRLPGLAGELTGHNSSSSGAIGAFVGGAVGGATGAARAIRNRFGGGSNGGGQISGK